MIFYFSATGNSKNVASIIAARTGERMVAIADAVRERELAKWSGEGDGGAREAASSADPASGAFSYDLEPGERIGFVTPTYFWGLPKPVEEFVRGLRLTRTGEPLAPDIDVYAYCVSTFGTTPGQGGRFLDDALRAATGVELAARFAVKMVDTWTPIFDLSDADANERLTGAAQEAARTVAEQVERRDRGCFGPAVLPPSFACGIAQRFYGPMSETSRFAVTDACIGCGLCAKKCPVAAIEMEGEGRAARPEWVAGRCALCLGCLHRCPKNAIEYGGSARARERVRAHGQFRNPHARV